MTTDPTTKMKIEKLDAKSIAACLIAEGLDPNGEVEVIAKRLAAHFLKTDGKGEMYECTECASPFPGRIKACCPFCAVDDDGNKVDATPQTYGAPEAAVEQMPAEPGAVDAKTKKIEERAKKKAEAAEAKKPKAPPKAPKPTSEVIEGVIEPVAVEKAKDEEAKTIALAKREEKSAKLAAGQRELDERVARVVQLKSDIAHGYWQLGCELQSIYDAQLWKQRLDDEGKPNRYKTSGFDAFVREECGFTATAAYQIMDVAKHYSEEQVKAFGYSKLGLVLKAPAPEQAKLLEEGVKAGKSVRELHEMVKEAITKHPAEPKVARDGTARHKPEGSGRQPRALAVPGGPPPEKTTKKDVITIASIPKRQKIAILAKPASKKDEPKPAKRLADEPYFEIEMENDVRLRVSISQNPKGELVAIVEGQREEDSGDE